MGEKKVSTETDKDPWRELKALVAFIASGAFVAVHKQFMQPVPDLFPYGHWTDIVHRYIHFGIGLFLQLLIVACLVWVARHIYYMFKTQKPKDMLEKKGSNESP